MPWLCTTLKEEIVGQILVYSVSEKLVLASMYIGRAMDIQLVFRDDGSYFCEKFMCVPKRLDGSRDCNVFELKG